MIVKDHTFATLVATGLLAFVLLAPGSNAARAEEPAADAAAAAQTSATAPAVTVTLVAQGGESTFSTPARTVRDLLAERDVIVGAGDYVSSALDAPVADGDRIVVRSAVPVRLAIGAGARSLSSTAASVGDLLRAENVRVGANDEVVPARTSVVTSGETIHVIRVASWTSHERAAIAPRTVARTDARLAAGKVETLTSGRSGVRETFVRFTRRDGGAPQRTVLATRIVREPQVKVIVRGLATYASLARVATQGFQSAVHMAGSALHMIATAYTASCEGCSGVTASGVRAGFGIIAVDPAIVPLGTRVFIPGYGRAVAGDTGGAILGHRVDLGFDSQSAAMSFGRRSVTLYVLR